MSLVDSLPQSNVSGFIIDKEGVKEIIPHRDPFLFVDGISLYKLEESIEGKVHFSANLDFFKGHFPNEPVVPGVIQVEALAQISCCLIGMSFDEVETKRPAFASISQVKFKRPVYPENTLILKSTLIRRRRGFYSFETQAELNGELVLTAIAQATMV